MANNITGASTSEIYNRLNGANEYHPFEANTFADPSIEAGDIVKIKRGTEEYSSPVHSLKMIWKGTPEISLSSTGKKERDAVAKVSKQKYRRGSGAMRNEYEMYYEFTSSDGYFHSSLLMTASVLRTEFNNSLSDVNSYILQTADQIYSTVYASESTVFSYVDQTATYISTHVENVASDLHSEIVQTQDMIHSAVWTANSEVFSYVDQTSTYIMTQVGNTASGLQSSIQQQADRISAVVSGTGSNSYIKPAAIQLGVNAATGQSKISLSADNIILDGSSFANYFGAQTLTLQDVNIYEGSDVYVGDDTTIHVGDDASLYSGGSYYPLANCIVSASVDSETNTLTLQPLVGDPINFSKAASTKVSGSWSGGVLTVSADENGENSYVRYFSRGTVSWQNDKKAANVYANVIRESGGSTYVDEADAFSLYVPTTESYNAGWDYGLTQRVRTTAEATSQELTIKTLDYGQRWTIKDTYTASNGTTSDVKYTVASPTDNNLIAGNIKSGVTIFGVAGSYAGDSTVTAEWQQSNPSSSANPYNKYVIKKDGTVQSGLTITVTPSVSISYNSNTHNYTATGAAAAGGALRGTTSVTGGTEAYTAGWDYGQSQRVRTTADATSQELTTKSLDFGQRWTITDTYTTSAGSTNVVKYTVSAPSRPADPSITSEWQQSNPSSSSNPYNKYVIKKDGTVLSGLTITVTAGASISYNSSTHKYTATGTASAGGSQRGSATSLSGTEAYDAGSTAGYNSAHLTSSWNSAGTRLTVTKTTSGSYNSLSFDVGADVAISYNSTFHTYYATGYALVDSITRASSGDTSGTEAYDAGYNTGYDAGYAAGSSGGITWAGMEIDGSTATSRTITAATDVDLIVRQNGSYITLQSITLTPSGGTTYSHSASIKCTSQSQETHGTVTVFTYTYTQSINSANPIVGVGSSRTVYWP